MNKILVVSNDNIFFSKKSIFSDYNDTLNIINTISKKFKIYLLSRKARVKQTHAINRNSIKKISLLDLLRLNKLDFKVFFISITPLNLIYFIILCSLFKGIEGYVYIRSDGYKEYFLKYGSFGKYFYDLMYKIINRKLKVISVNSKLTNINTKLKLFPSEITSRWKIRKLNSFNKYMPKLLYFGRFRKEKGVYSLIEMFEKINQNYKLTLAGDDKLNLNHKNLSYVGKISSIKKIIELYDKHDIFILPSYTEGYPKVILESLSREKPIIIFDDIKHVKNNFKGIYVAQRNYKDLKKKIKFIINNYKLIKKELKKNNISTKKDFQKSLLKVLI